MSQSRQLKNEALVNFMETEQTDVLGNQELQFNQGQPESGDIKMIESGVFG